MKRCIECGDHARNKRSYLCEGCFDEIFLARIQEDADDEQRQGKEIVRVK